MKIDFLSPKGPQPAEQIGLNEFRSKLPPSWKGYANFYLRNEKRRGQDREVDVVLITPDRLIIVDLKHGRGKFESRSGSWFQNGEPIGQSAATKIRENAKVLASTIRKHVQQIPGAPPVESAVVFTNPQADFSGLEQHEKDRCFTIDDFTRIGNESIFRTYFTTRSDFGGSASLAAGQHLFGLQRFFTNDKHVGATPAKYHGFIPTGTPEFRHPLYEEFSCQDEANPKYTGLLRLWDFSRDPEAFAVEELRRPVAERERTALGHIRATNPHYFDNFVLRSQAHDREYGLNFSEVFEKHPDLVRLTRYVGTISELPTDRRVDIAKLFLDRVAELHRVKLAHRDLDRHSIWIDERRSSVVLSGFGASHFPDVDTIGDKRAKLLAGGVRTPEDTAQGSVASPFRQDVFLSAAAVFGILTARRIELVDDVPYWSEKLLETAEMTEYRHFQAWFERALDWDPSKRFNDGIEASSAFVDAISRSPSFNVEKQLAQYRREIDLMDYAANVDEWFKRTPYRVLKSGPLLIKNWPQQYIGDLKTSALALLAFFSRGARLEGLAAPWAPRVRQCCLCMDGLFLAQDWVDGSKLLEVDWSGHDEGSITAFLKKLFDAVDELHAAGLSHGDLKPANIIVSQTEEGASVPVFIDLLDFSRPDDGERLSPAYCPPYQNDDLQLRDRFAAGQIAVELIDAWVQNSRHETRLQQRIAEGVLKSNEEGDYWSTLQPLRDSLSAAKSTSESVGLDLSVEFRDPKFPGAMLADNGRFYVVLREAKNQIEIYGFDQKLQIDFDRKDMKPHKAAMYSVGAKESNWAGSNSVMQFQGEIRIAHALTTRFAGFESIFGQVATRLQSTEEQSQPVDAVTEGSVAAEPAKKPILSLPGGPAAKAVFPVAKFWEETILAEEEILPEIKLIELPRETHEPGTILLTCNEVPAVDAVDVRTGQFATVTWNGERIGDLDTARAGHGKVLVRNARSFRRLQPNDVLKIQSPDNRSSFRRRSRAVDRILRGQAQIANLISYFNPVAKIEPAVVAEPIPAGALDKYGLNPQQEEAFRHLWANGPVGLLQGPPGTGKTYFTSAFVHWALNDGKLRNVLVLSQSHEAVNTVAERVLKVFNDRGGEVDLLRVGQYDKISPQLRRYHSQSVQDRYRELFRAELKDRVSTVARKLGLDRGYVREAVEIEASIGSIVRQIELAEQDLGSTDLDADVVAAAGRRLGTLNRTLERFLADEIVPREGTPFEILDEVRDEIAKRHHVFDPDARDRLLRLLDLSRSWLSVLSARSRNLEEFLARSRNLVCGTCVGIGRHGLGLEKGVFDLVIIDEAARCTPGELAVGMQSGKRILLVGDHRQLPPLFEHDALKAMAKKLPGFAAEDFKKSDFERAFSSSYGKSIARTLKTQYRMAAEIGSLVSETFYPGEDLETDREPPSNIYDHLPAPFDKQVVWLDTGLSKKGSNDSEVGTSFINRREAIEVISLLKKIAASQVFLAKAPNTLELKDGEALIGVICTYAQQAELIENMIVASDLPSDFRSLIKVDTVDAYQGKENRIVILSVVRNNSEDAMGHVKSRNRVNVAISRAMDRLLIIGAAAMFEKGNNSLKPIVRHLKAKNRIIPITALGGA
ncbi:AAA domain-containing protein [Rhizobium multihospitium]|uniref:Protein kinase domain-containing protein n=1 Tax=Rhizobium multihospitium TaxID=410764 RepID=A0A1C3X3S3_9HYPH|nr:AAA domain-containing protein [Rhizobium multihospitium]SCB46910.1 Protein kinase domain-containing protein [Rhizobium multihospitium]